MLDLCKVHGFLGQPGILGSLGILPSRLFLAYGSELSQLYRALPNYLVTRTLTQYSNLRANLMFLARGDCLRCLVLGPGSRFSHLLSLVHLLATRTR